MFGKIQGLYLAAAFVLVVVLYFGFNRHPDTIKALETSRAITGPAFDIPALEREAAVDLPVEKSAQFHGLSAALQVEHSDSARREMWKRLSGFWFGERKPVLAGLYARQVAEAETTALSWSIAGSSFITGLASEEADENKRSFGREQAVAAFEKAISLEPGVLEHRINQALCYVEVPPADQPMKGIQMLSGLASSYPDAPAPAFQLARLAVRTGQFERARTRIEQALALAPEDARIACLAIDIYTALGQADKAKALAATCAKQPTTLSH